MPKLVLLRHGESDWNRENRFTGWTDVDLSQRGVEEARHPHAVARARRARPDVAAGREELAAERAALRRSARPEQGRDGGEIRRAAGARLAAQLRHAPP